MSNAKELREKLMMKERKGAASYSAAIIKEADDFAAGYKKFLEGTYAGEYEAKLIREFESLLPEVPPWQK